MLLDKTLGFKGQSAAADGMGQSGVLSDRTPAAQPSQPSDLQQDLERNASAGCNASSPQQELSEGGHTDGESSAASQSGSERSSSSGESEQSSDGDSEGGVHPPASGGCRRDRNGAQQSYQEPAALPPGLAFSGDADEDAAMLEALEASPLQNLLQNV